MTLRRSFLGAASLGLMPAWSGFGSAFAQAVTSEPLQADERINRVLEATRGVDRRLPGMIGAIVKGPAISGIGVVGIRKIGSDQKFKLDDQVHLGSCTKAMTATMIGTLVEQKKLRWDSTFLDVFPTIARAFHPDYQAVTLKQLMAHRAGLPRDVSWWELGPSRSPTEQRRALMSKLLREAPRNKPGSAYDYSNVGFALAGLMAEEVSKTPWEQLIKRKLFDPLGMTTAGFGSPGTKGKVDQPWGHRASGELIEPTRFDNPASLGPAGTVHCSIADWAKFASAHMKGEPGKTRLLEPETFEALHTPEPGQDYVAGWAVSRDHGRGNGPILTHNGSNGAWFSAIWLAPDLNLAVLVATNAGTDAAGKACNEAIQGLLSLESYNRRMGGRR